MEVSMNIFTELLVSTFAITSLYIPSLTSETLIYRTPEGAISTLEISAETPFTDVVKLLHSEFIVDGSLSVNSEITFDNDFVLDFMVDSDHTYGRAISPKASMRQYHATLTDNEKRKIAHTIETLGNSSLVSLAREKSALEKEGREIEHIHPLKFLACIFSEERLKAAMHNIHGRSWVWGQFFKGLKEALETEHMHENLLPYIQDFSNHLKISSKKIYALVEKQRWKEFIEILFIEIPRSENSTRYDM
jgi:AAA+ ATPase superfamily predicted ATPase